MARFGLIIGAATIAASIALGAGVAMAARSNDDLKGATRVRTVPYEAAVIDTTHATKEVGEPQPICLMGAMQDVSQSVWYRIDVDASSAGEWDFNTAGSTYDTVMTLYRAPSRGRITFGGLEVVDCNDDNHLGQITSKARFFAAMSPGRYYVQVGDYGAPNMEQPHTTSFRISPITGLAPIELPLP